MKTTATLLKVTSFLLALSIAFSCTKEKEEPVGYLIEGIVLDRSQAELVPGETLTLTAILLPYNVKVDENTSWGDDIKGSVCWRSDNPNVAAVDENGLVTAKGIGTCKVSFVCGTMTVDCMVTVRMFNKDALYGLWNQKEPASSLLLAFNGTGYMNDRFFDWTFDGMRLSIFYKNSTTDKASLTMIITSVNQGLHYYLADDSLKHSFNMQRVPMDFTADDLTLGQTDRPAQGDKAISVVDMGLPSGLLWASCNLGADSCHQDGMRYAWADNTVKQSFSLENYRWYDNLNYDLTKYVDDSVLEMQADDDPVTAALGQDWHTPSAAQVQELFDNCYVLYSRMSGREGFIFIPRNEDYSDRRLFIPFSLSSNIIESPDLYKGSDGSRVYEKYGFFWTSTLSSLNPFEAYSFCINLDHNGGELLCETGKSRRYYGLCTRPVYLEKN